MIEKRAPSETVFLDKSDTVKPSRSGARRNARRLSMYSLLFSGVSSWEIINTQISNVSANYKVTNPLEYALTYHSGDFLDGFENAWLAAAVLGLLNVPYKTRTPIAVGLSALALSFAEIQPLSHLIHNSFGTPDLADLPAGLLGLGVFAATSLIARKMAKI